MIVNQQAFTKVAAELAEKTKRLLSQQVDVAELAKATESLKAITAPFLTKLRTGTACRNDLREWRSELTKAGLRFIDCSRDAGIALQGKRTHN